MKLICCLLWVFFCLHLNFSVGQEINRNRLDSLFSGLEANNKFMGSVSVFRDGKEVYAKAVGFRDVEKKILADVHTQYRIGSITKTFTTVLIMKAVEKGKLSLDDKLSKWFPQIGNADDITIRLMLRHRSGIGNFTNDSGYIKWNVQQTSKDELLKRIIRAGNTFKPGEKFEYSNSGFVLLGWIIEGVYKMPYRKALEKFIIKPGGLKETAIGSRIEIEKNQSRSYHYFDGWKLNPEADMSVPFSAGNLISTPADINRFAHQLINERFISRKSLDTMQNFKEGVGLGMFMIPFNDKKAFGHTGGIDAFQSVYAYFPKEKLGYALTSNGTNYVINDISIKVLSAAFGFDFTLPVYHNRNLTAVALDSYTGTYASSQVPLKISFFKKGDTLMSQATGQMAFPLVAYENHIFRADQFGIEVQFDLSRKNMILRQSGAAILFLKQ